MKNLMLILVTVFAIQFANAQSSLTKKEMKKIYKTIVCDEPDYSFISNSHKKGQKMTLDSLYCFNAGEIYYLVVDEGDFIFVGDTIIGFKELNLNSEKKNALKKLLKNKIIFKCYAVSVLPKHGAYVDINKRRAIVAYEDKGGIIDFECQAGSPDYTYLKFITQKERK